MPSAPITRSYSRGAVAELDRTVSSRSLEPANVGSHPNRHVAGPLEQHGMEVCPLKREAGPDAIPQLRQIDLDKQPAAVIADALSRDHDSPLQTACSRPSARSARAAFPGR